MTSPENRQLLRLLGPWTAIAIVIGTVIGSGVFKKPQAVAERLNDFGPTMLVWVLGGLLALLGALVLAEIAVILPRAGGNYVYLKVGYGRPFGFMWGWVEFWIIRASSIAALAGIFVDSLHDVIRQLREVPYNQEVLTFWVRQAMTISTIAFLALINARGTRWGGSLQVFLTIVKVGSLLAISLLPFIFWGFTTEPVPTVRYLEPCWPQGDGSFRWSQFGAALVGVLWAYHGWMNIAPVAEEVRDPKRNIPLALIGGTLVVIVLYLGANLAYALVVPRPEIAELRTTTVATVFSTRLLGVVGALFASAAVMISVFGSCNGNLLVGPRLLFAMGRDRLAPSWLSRIHARYQTPALATLVLATWSCTIVAVGGLLTQIRLPAFAIFGWNIDPNLPQGKPLFDVVTDFAMFGAISLETLALSTIFVLRCRYPVDVVTLPYRCLGYPFVPIIYIAVMGLVLANMFISQRSEAIVGLVFIAMGLLVYFTVIRRGLQEEPEGTTMP